MSDISTTRIFTDGERGITATKLNDIIGSSVIQPAFYTSKPIAGSADPADIALILKSGAYAQVPISALAGSATQAQIWSTRLNSYNAINNPNFEVDQRNVGTTVVNAGGMFMDRWACGHTGTLAVSAGQLATGVALPGTSFLITRSPLRVTLTTAQASLAAGDNLQIIQTVEGPNLRELIFGVHSISLLVRSSVSNLNFSVRVSDTPVTKSLVKLCNIPTANVWTLITLPNIPVWPSGNFSYNPGAAGYVLGITLAAGTSQIAAAADTWQTASVIGAPGMDNFASKPVNSTFDVAFVQHEPGAVCSTLMDKPFSQNLDECLRYYQKSYDYATAIGTVTAAGCVDAIVSATTTNWAICARGFQKPMAKIPTVVIYDPNNGAINSLFNNSAATHVGTSGFNALSTKSIGAISLSTAQTAGHWMSTHYTADTGW